MGHNSTEYSTSKALWHHSSIEMIKKGQQPYPVHLELVISDLCNHSCGFCSYRMDGHPSNSLFGDSNRQIPTNKCYEILDSAVEIGVKAVQFTGGGEPTIHPDFPTIAAYANHIGLETSLVTNGSRLFKAAVRDEAKLMKWVRVSIDAADPEHYVEERKVNKGLWKQMIAGVALLNRERSDSLTLGAGFVVTPRNYRQIHSAAVLYRALGFDHVRFGLMFNPDDEKPYIPIWKEIQEQAEMAKEEGRDNFQVIDRTQERFDEFAQQNEGAIDYDFCAFQNFTNYVGGDLNVYRCCQWAFNPRGLIGSIKDRTLKELYDSPEKKEDFKSFISRGCKKCQFNNTNNAVNAHLANPTETPLLSTEPFHANFV